MDEAHNELCYRNYIFLERLISGFKDPEAAKEYKDTVYKRVYDWFKPVAAPSYQPLWGQPSRVVEYFLDTKTGKFNGLPRVIGDNIWCKSLPKDCRPSDEFGALNALLRSSKWSATTGLPSAMGAMDGRLNQAYQ